MLRSSLLYKIVNGFKDMCYIWAKEMRNVLRDEGVLMFCILVPIGYPLLYSWIYNNEVVREVDTAIVDLSHSHTSREFIRDYDAAPDTKATYYCNSLDEAKELVQRQAVHGIIYIPSDFDTQLNRGEQAHVSVYTDMSLMLTYKAIYQTAQAVASHINSGIQVAQGGGFTDRDDEITTEPLAFDEVPIFNTTGGYGNAILPGVLMLILQQTLLLGIGMAAGTSRELNRNRELVPVSEHYGGIFRIVFGKALCYFMIYAVMGMYLALVVPKLFSFVSMVSWTTILGFLLPFILSCIFFGLMLSCLVRYRENVMLLVVFTSVPLLFMTGISWPQSNIPAFWQGFAWVFPSTFGVRGFLRISSMGASLSDILPEFRALWIQTGVYFLGTCLVFRQQLRNARLKANLPAELAEEEDEAETLLEAKQ